MDRISRRIALRRLVVCLATIGAACAGSGAREGGATGGTLAASGSGSAVFDYDWSVQRIGGGEVELEALRGRPLVVNFWASWCPPCIRELGSFEALAESVREQGIDATFLFVSPESLDVASAFVVDNGWDLPFAVELRRAPPTLGDLVLPTTFIVGPDGAVVVRHRGATDWNQPDVVELLASLDGRGRAEPGVPSPREASR